MIDFIGSTFTTATIAWLIAFGTFALSLDDIGATIGATALLLSGFAFASLAVGAIAWVIRHVRITII